MANFIVQGPLRIVPSQGKGGKAITDEKIQDFWQLHSRFEKRRGCYVFGIRAGKGFTPGYVGKATKSLRKEIFASHKLVHYHTFLTQYAKGAPVFFFVLAPIQKGKPNNAEISAVEKYLITLGITANPGLMNAKGTKQPKWAIKGVIRGGKGKITKGTKDFRQMMGVRK